jgi:chaperonin GroES
MSKLQPLNGFVALKPIETQEETYGNIVLPDLGKERPEMGEVAATSQIYNYHSDKWVPSQLKIGDLVLIPKMGSQRIVVEGEEYFIVRETDIFSIVKLNLN